MDRFPKRGPAGDRLTRYGWEPVVGGTVVCATIAAVLVWLALAAGVWSAWWVPLPVAAWLFLLCFFRNPRRSIPTADNVVVSPADGEVVDVRRIEKEEFIGGPATRISIFLSVFDVHVNRAPVAGNVSYLEHRRGTYRHARTPEAGKSNECQSVGQIMKDETRVLTRQIAGFIARRIICPLEDGSYLDQGVDFGMIRFGSRTEISVPDRNGRPFQPRVKEGDRVRGGSSVVGAWEEAPG
jgi:phosphatidylserine decarboxylase